MVLLRSTSQRSYHAKGSSGALFKGAITPRAPPEHFSKELSRQGLLRSTSQELSRQGLLRSTSQRSCHAKGSSGALLKGAITPRAPPEHFSKELSRQGLLRSTSQRSYDAKGSSGALLKRSYHAKTFRAECNFIPVSQRQTSTISFATSSTKSEIPSGFMRLGEEVYHACMCYSAL